MFFRCAVLFITLGAGAVAGRGAAAQNVLLPNDNNNGGALPNLGLMPAEAPPAPATAPPQKKDAETARQAAPSPAAPVKFTPASLPPEQPVQPPMPSAHSMDIVLSPSSLNANDITNLNNQLGIAPNSVARQCRMGINGMLLTDTGSAAVESNQTPSLNVIYDGTLTNAILTVYAVCASAPKPASYVYLQKMGGGYLVSLSGATCAPPASYTGAKQRLTITHALGGSDSCSYR